MRSRPGRWRPILASTETLDLAIARGMKSDCSPLNDCGCFDRRSFLKLTGAAALSLSFADPLTAIAGPFEPSDTADHFVPADKKLRPEWVGRLFAKGEPDWYTGGDLKQIGMPVGGICAGQLYLAGDGTLTHWDIFNDSPEDARSGTHYQRLPPPVAAVRQGFAIRCITPGKTTTRTLDKSGFSQVRFRGEYPVGKVEYGDSGFPVQVALEAFSPFIPLSAEDSALPATVMHFTVKNSGGEAVEVLLAGCLENAVGCRSGEFLEMVRENRFVEGRDFVGLLGAAREAKTDKQPARAPIVVADFEPPDYGGWKVEGEAFGARPATGTLPHQQVVSGFQGKGLVNTFLSGDQPHGKLTSPEFKIERAYLNFLIGGGGHAERTCMNLLVGGKRVRSATGRNNEKLSWQSWGVADLLGKQAQLEIVDAESGSWGHVNVDQIEQSDRPRRRFEGPLDAQPDYGSMGLALLGSAQDILYSVDLGEESLAAWLGSGLERKSAAKVEKAPHQQLTGALGRRLKLAPGQQAGVSFVVAWHFKNLPQHGNHYGVRFPDALAVAEYVAGHFDRLAGQTRLWRDTWYDSTLPWWLLDRLFAPTSILASATCQRWANGRFWGWEGVRCCAGTCAHVWNYEHALARLFPDLERSVREMQDFNAGFVQATGAIHFRGESNDLWAGDSQGGTAMKCLREFQMAGDREFLRRNWPAIRKSVEFLIKEDQNADGLLEGSQHNTYDINFFGANTMVGSLYLGALRAAEEFAREMGDAEFAAQCRTLFEAGSRHTVERLFNGEYFIQKVDLTKHPRDQYAEGCLADQLFGQGWAHQVGLGYLYPKEKVRSALKAIWTYNWAPDIGPQNATHPPERWFARPGEAGLFICTWPKSKHLGEQSVRYRDEVWTGIEYQVAGHMAWEGMVTEALAICRGVHERHHPARQNPWNEVECGDHYARAMASHGVFLGLCGFECDGPRGVVGFAPRLAPDKFKAAFTSAQAWGSIEQQRSGTEQRNSVRVRWGNLRVRSLRLEIPENAKLAGFALSVGGEKVQARSVAEGAKVSLELEKELELSPSATLEAALRWG